jgi:type IV secretory pathway VirB4 component
VCSPRLHCPLESMQESDKLRRSKLIREVTEHRDLLSMLKITDRRAPSFEQEAIARRNQEITDKLRALENELHALNVQLIREGLSDKPD